METQPKVKVYERYPLSSVLVYNGVTLLHFLLGGIGIMWGYNSSWAGYLLGLGYLLFSFTQMYLIMPLKVCPNCFYHRTQNTLCTSGLNVFSKKIAKEGEPERFTQRSQGLLCHNNLYMAALLAPLITMVPALILNFSFALLAIFLVVLGLLLFRFFVIFGRIACLHCRAKQECPNAKSMGLEGT